jgi:hypothetical protein
MTPVTDTLVTVIGFNRFYSNLFNPGLSIHTFQFGPRAVCEADFIARAVASAKKIARRPFFVTTEIFFREAS